jgi:hypothetical protein
MATKLISNGAFSGAYGAILAGRAITSTTLADYDATIAAADAFRDQFLTANAALTVPMTDADNTEIGQLIEGVCFAVLEGRPYSSATAASYAEEAAAAAAAAKQAVAALA